MGCGQGIFFHVYLGRPTPEKQERCNEARIVVKISRDKIWKAENPSRDNLRHFGTFFFFVYLKTENKVNNKIRCKSSVTNTNYKELPLNFCFCFFFFSFGQSEREKKKGVATSLEFSLFSFSSSIFSFFFITGQAKQEMRRRRAKKNNGPFHLGLCWLHRVARKKEKRDPIKPQQQHKFPRNFLFFFLFFFPL